MLPFFSEKLFMFGCYMLCIGKLLFATFVLCAIRRATLKLRVYCFLATFTFSGGPGGCPKVCFLPGSGPTMCSFLLGSGGVAVCVVSRRVRVTDPFAICGLARWCAAATGTGRPRLRLEVAGAFLIRQYIRLVPCDVQARFG